MKVTVSKSEVMKRAWAIFRNPQRGILYLYFSDCLARAWYILKDNAKNAALKAEIEEDAKRCIAPVGSSKYYEILNSQSVREANYKGLNEYYHGVGSKGRYYGD